MTQKEWEAHLVKCFNCGTEVDIDKDAHCPKCGQCATGTC
jgi:DNA-directed RNA polymerase subunit RPC12/RpoP